MIKKKSVIKCIHEWREANGTYSTVAKSTLEGFIFGTRDYYTCSGIRYEFNYYNKIKEIIAAFKIIYLIKDHG